MINIFGSKSRTLTQQFFFSSTRFAHFLKTFCTMTSY